MLEYQFEYQILCEYSPNISICFSPTLYKRSKAGVIWVDWDLEVWVHLSHPILWLEVCEEVKALHIKMLLPHKLVEAFQIYCWPLTPILLHQKYLGHIAVWGESL